MRQCQEFTHCQGMKACKSMQCRWSGKKIQVYHHRDEWKSSSVHHCAVYENIEEESSHSDIQKGLYGTKAQQQPEFATKRNCQCFCAEGKRNNFVGNFQRVYNSRQRGAEQVFTAVFANDEGWLRQLLNAGISPNVCDSQGICALMVAANACSEAVLAPLVEHNVDPSLAFKRAQVSMTAADMVPTQFLSGCITQDTSSKPDASNPHWQLEKACSSTASGQHCRCCNVKKSIMLEQAMM